MAFEIDFQNNVDAPDIPTARITAAISQILTAHRIPPDTSLTIVITDDDQVAALNEQFRGVAAPTDVLSFPADDPLPPSEWHTLEESDLYLGDLLIAYPYTVHQAAELGHAIADELILLSIHGTLHLLGYDHDTPENQDAMWRVQHEALSGANVPIVVPRFTFDDPALPDDGDTF